MKRYRDFYGSTASIVKTINGYHLTVKTSHGKKVIDKTYSTERGAKSAMSKSSDGWNKIA